jgi:eukaryotic-like serine/threonine-protein kinase
VPVYTPTDEASFNAWLSHYRYDKTPLDAEIIEVKETDAWRREKIVFKGADDQRAIAYLYLPKNVPPPFQIMQFVPAGDVYGGYITIAEATEMLLAPLIKSGRAVFAVVFKGFKERGHPADYAPPPGASVRFREEMVNHAIDLRRGLDYLETRNDVETRRIIYYGYSQGAEEGLVYTAVEDRYRAVVLVAGGVRPTAKPWIAEAWPLNFASHIRAPS